MNVAPQPHPGARVLVLWTDGKRYPATVCTLSQGFVQVRWDTGGAPAWAPLAVVSPLGAAEERPPAATPAMATWEVRPEQAKREAPKPAPEAAQPAGAQQARPMKDAIGGLPRGLVFDPTGSGPGDGKAFFFFFGFVATADVDL